MNKTILCMLLMIALFIPLTAEDFMILIDSRSDPLEGSEFLGRYFEGIGSTSTRSDRYVEEELLPYEPPVNPVSQLADSRWFFYEEDGEVLRFRAEKVYDDPLGSCAIYVQRSGALYTRDWQAAGEWFDRQVYPVVTQAFGEPHDLDGNSKVLLVFYKISDPYMSGYFIDTDLYDSSLYSSSNQGEIIYFNLQQPDLLGRDMKETYPHELQHLINSSYRMENSLPPMPLWMDEGLAESAAQLVLGEDWLYDQNIWNDPDGYFWKGTSLVKWDGKLEDYGLSYLFLQYLRGQYGNPDIFGKLIEHPQAGLSAVLSVLRQKGIHFASSQELMISFYLAIALQQPGRYGFGELNGTLDLTPRSPEGGMGAMIKPGSAQFLPLKSKAPHRALPDYIHWIDTRDYR